MADAGIALVWQQAKTGREGQAMELFNSTLSYYTQQRERGNIESFEPVLLRSHGGEVAGWIIIRGSAEQMDTLQRSDEFRSFTVQANYCLDGLGIIDAYLGDGLMQIMGEWSALIAKG